jgi:predicted transcriptional regulator
MTDVGAQMFVKISSEEKKEKFDELLKAKGLKQKFVIEKAIDDFIDSDGNPKWMMK